MYHEVVLPLTLPLNVPTRDRLLIEGVHRYVANDKDHPAARFYARDDIRQQIKYEADKLEQEARARELGNLAMQPTLGLELDHAAA